MTITWQQLQQYHLNPPTKALPRKTNYNIAYSKYTKAFSTAGTTLEKEINIALANHTEPYVITHNKFSYDLESKIHHYVVWKNPYSEQHPSIQNFIRSKFKGKYVVYKNRPGHCSVENIDHYQLFTLEPIEIAYASFDINTNRN